MKANSIPAIRLTIVCLLLFSGLYTFVVWGAAQLMPNGGRGDRVTENGQTRYTNLGQAFTDDAYFMSRPSAVNYNAAGSGASNKAPSDPAYLQTVQARIDTFLRHNPGVSVSEIPVDLVTASGSGLDPNISVQAARVQVKRIARVRGLDEKVVAELVNAHIEKPWLGLFGPEKINVTELNVALDKMK